MTTIEAYRAIIGSFCSKEQRHAQLSKLADLSDAYKWNSKFPDHNAEQLYFLKAFVTFLFVVILYLKMDFALFELFTLLADGDIESNPGPTSIHKNNGTNDKFYRKVAFLMYTEMFNFRPQS